MRLTQRNQNHEFKKSRFYVVDSTIEKRVYSIGLGLADASDDTKKAEETKGSMAINIQAILKNKIQAFTASVTKLN